MARSTRSYVTIDIEIIPSTTGSGYQVDARITGVTSAFRYDRKVLQEISINLEKWKDLDNTLKSLDARGTREENQVREFGKSLFQQVIKGEVYLLYKHGKDYSSDRGHTLRLRLHLGSPALIELPWEFLYEEGEFLGLTTDTDYPRILVMRCPIGAKPISAVEHHLPLQIMIMAAESQDYPVGAKEEKRCIREHLDMVVNEGKISIKDVEGTFNELGNIRINKTLDVFHFIGHGNFNADAQEGELTLEGGRNIPGYKFSRFLPSSVKLVFLNACETARGNAHEPSSSIAYILAKQRRVVIAMQFRISVAAAVHFASVFYSEIAGGVPIDEAVAEARLSVFTMPDCNPLDWAAPVLYMKSKDGVLFDIKDPIVATDEEEKETEGETSDIAEEQSTPSLSGSEELPTTSNGETSDTAEVQSALSPLGSGKPSLSGSEESAAYYNEGKAQYARKRYQEALKAYKQAVGIDPNYVDAYNGIGDALYDLEQYEEALKACEQAVHLDPNNAYAYYNKCLILDRLGRSKEARLARKKAKELGLD